MCEWLCLHLSVKSGPNCSAQSDSFFKFSVSKRRLSVSVVTREVWILRKKASGKRGRLWLMAGICGWRGHLYMVSPSLCDTVNAEIDHLQKIHSPSLSSQILLSVAITHSFSFCNIWINQLFCLFFPFSKKFEIEESFLSLYYCRQQTKHTASKSKRYQAKIKTKPWVNFKSRFIAFVIVLKALLSVTSSKKTYLLCINVRKLPLDAKC